MNQPAQVVNLKNVVFGVSLAFFATSLFIQIFITNKYAVKGVEMANLEKQKDDLEKSISKLQIEKSNLSALTEVEARARKLGFVPMLDDVYSIKPISVASLPSYSN